MKHFFHRFRRLHFVGINGTGMCGIAELLLRYGFKITGSDLVDNEVSARLRKLGAEVAVGHAAENVKDADLVIYSSACKPDNVELLEAKKNDIPVISRAEMLGELMRLQLGIAVAGAHGKSTTSSMLGTALKAGGLDPTIIVGGRLQSAGGHSEAGESEWLVAEADEYDRSFLHLMPVHAILTNLEHEHIDTYPTYAEMEDAFVQFANRVPFYGSLVICGDDPGLQAIKPRFKRTVVTYGLNETNRVRAVDIEYDAGITNATILDNNETLGTLALRIPGVHNLRNALAVIAMCRRIGVLFEPVAHALKEFRGVGRRYEIVGVKNGITFVDDYAHHPTEVAATIAAARSIHSGRIVAVFQPHLFTRTARFYEQFALALAGADVVFVADVYPSREQPTAGITGMLVSDAMRRNGHKIVNDLPLTGRVEAIRSVLKPGDLVVGLGAGDITKTIHGLVKEQ